MTCAAAEVWRRVPSIQTIEVSSHGRVRAVARAVPMPRGGVKICGGSGTFGQWDGVRYLYILHGRTHKVARLVCEAFNGPPSAGLVCMHLDENSRNNRPENLRWGTQRENLNAPKFLEYCRTRKIVRRARKERSGELEIQAT